MKRYYGMSRTVYVVGKYAIKIPSFRNGQTLFISGMLANLFEKERWDKSKHPALMPVYFCFPLGIFTVNQAYDDILGRALTSDELKEFPIVNIDNNGKNIGIGEHGFVLLDYGNADAYLVVA